MKVVRIIARLNVGGPARHVTWLTAAMRLEGIESLLVAGTVPPGEGDMTYFAQAHQVEPVIIPEMSREISVKDGLTIWRLYRLLLAERPDIVHTHTAKAGTVGRLAGLLYRYLTPSAVILRPRACRFVHTYHGHIFHSYYGRVKTRLFLLIEQILARINTDRIVVISPQQYHEIHEQFRVGRREQFSIIPLGLDLSLFADWRRRRNTLRAELGAEEDEILVGIVGRLTEIKNHKLFLEAAALYQQERARSLKAEDDGGSRARRVRFVVVGDGQLLPDLKEQARSLGLVDDIIFLGQRDDPENFYAALDVLALTSLNEGTPLTLIEAMASERAVVAVAVGGVVDLLGQPVDAKALPEDDYTICEHGVRVRERDARAFSLALERIIEDERLRAEVGERGRRFVEENYSKERLVADVTNLYQELMRRDQTSTRDISPPEALHSRRRV